MKQMKKGIVKVGFSIIIIFMVPRIVFSWPIPDTGQTKCYDGTGEIPCPSPGEEFYGQDGNYTINPMSFTKLDAGSKSLPDSAPEWVMVKDNITGLIWEVKQDADGIVNYDNPHDADNSYTWYDSNLETNGGEKGTSGDGKDTEDFINKLNTETFGGYDEWRLPNRQELRSIVNYGQTQPSIDITYFPNTQDKAYWSSSSFFYADGRAWGVDFIDGWDSDFLLHSGHSVRAVFGRQSQISNHFVINGDGTVSDINTGLMWQQVTAPGRYTWLQALNYCETFNLAGYNDWRLPTIKELESIVDLSIYPAIDTNIFPYIPSCRYWSSVTSATNSSESWFIFMDLGYVGFYNVNKNGNNYFGNDGLKILAVRGGQTVVVNPDIKANGSDEPLNIYSSDSLSIKIQLVPGGFASENADWWLVAATPFGLFHYQPVDSSWAPDLTYSHQGSLFNLGEFEALNISGLPVGSYTLYFGVDMLMNGSLDMEQAYYDSVTVNIQ